MGEGHFDVAAMIIAIKGAVLVAAVFTGAGTIWMGYSLFVKNILSASDASGSGMGFKIRLARTAPGTFFALMGAGIICMAIYHPFNHVIEPGEIVPKPPAQVVPVPKKDPVLEKTEAKPVMSEKELIDLQPVRATLDYEKVSTGWPTMKAPGPDVHPPRPRISTQGESSPFAEVQELMAGRQKVEQIRVEPKYY